MSEETVRTRQIGDYEVKERLPLNYDLLEELANKAEKLRTMIFIDTVNDFIKEDEILLNRFLVYDVVSDWYSYLSVVLWSTSDLAQLITRVFAQRAIFNLVCNEETQRHVETFKACKDTNKAWELFNRIQYLINNFETKILLSDTGDIEDV